MFQCILLVSFLFFCADSQEFREVIIEEERYISVESEVPWNYFMLVTEWPQSSCEHMNASHHVEHNCVIPSVVKGWVLHGLWPSSNEGQQPFYCEPWKFDYNKVKDLEDELMEYWPNLFADTSLTSFWKHEYEKHGTCAASVQGFEDEHEYFQRAMELKNEYDMMTALAAHGISPSDDPYQLEDITSAVETHFSTKVCIQCSYTESTGQLLSGAYVCLSKDLQLIDCERCETPCYSDEEVHYHPLHY